MTTTRHGVTRDDGWWASACAELDGKCKRQPFILVQAARKRKTLVQLGMVPLHWGVVYEMCCTFVVVSLANLGSPALLYIVQGQVSKSVTM